MRTCTYDYIPYMNTSRIKEQEPATKRQHINNQTHPHTHTDTPTHRHSAAPWHHSIMYNVV